MDILHTIVEDKKVEVASLKAKRRSFRQALLDGSGIIAEFKRKSPSKGWIHEGASPVEVAVAYEKAGASCMSVLTDSKYFGGCLQDLRDVRAAVNLPLLRKDFIIDPYQIMQAREAGADAVLLIAACLEKNQCAELAAAAHEMGLETLLETHSLPELEYVGANIDMVGVNNRNLGTFVTDIANSYKLASALPKDYVLVSESGISKSETIRELKAAGFSGFLIGETFMKEDNPGDALASFISRI